MKARRVVTTAIVCVLLALTGSGCNMAEKNEMEEQQYLAQLEERLRTWPTLEDTTQQITNAINDIAQAITARVPTLQFQVRRGPRQGTCSGDYHRNRIGGVEMETEALSAKGPIPDDVWPDVLADARRIAASYGVTGIEVRADKPGYHSVRLYDDTWNQIYLGHAEATSIRATTGCRLKASAG